MFFLTADRARAAAMLQTAAAICRLGAGPLREHPGPEPCRPSPPDGFRGLPDGADLVRDPDLIRQQFPFVAPDVAAMLHVRRCGWLRAPRLGRCLLERAVASGVRLVRDRVVSVQTAGGRVQAVTLASGGKINTRVFVIAAGPRLPQAGAMLGLDLPVFCELHGKMALEDRLGVIPRDAPLMIWNDPVRLDWSELQRPEFPAGVHFRPREQDGKPVLLIIWTYDVKPVAPAFPPRFDAHYPEVLLRGLARMVPGLTAYFGQGASGLVDGGYYCKTRENRPLIGPLPVEGAFVIGALSGYGIMGSQAAAELLAAHVTGSALPDYAPAFLLRRYEDPGYQRRLPELEALGGQL
ncbi:MAG TPA: FAD-binding oxidoreductase [Bryobacterales bacterium]|nr:FAD-binding oxidoreductase [Bryobacterales bacterium]